MTALPAHLRGISRVVMDTAVTGHSHRETASGKSFPILEPEILEEGQALTPGMAREDILYLKHYKGRFLRHCPGTSHYRCCGYQIIHIGENCPLRCSYCILQAYFQDRVLKVWANQQDLWDELGASLPRQSGPALQSRHRRIHGLPGPGGPDGLQPRSGSISGRLSAGLSGAQIQGRGSFVDGRGPGSFTNPAGLVHERSFHRRE